MFTKKLKLYIKILKEDMASVQLTKQGGAAYRRVGAEVTRAFSVAVAELSFQEIESAHQERKMLKQNQCLMLDALLEFAM